MDTMDSMDPSYLVTDDPDDELQNYDPGSPRGIFGEDGLPGGDQKISAKFLLSNAAAGSVIGKGGVTISEFQAQSGARIQLSRNRAYFPGTTERILLVTGSVNGILTALHLILSKLLMEDPSALESDPLQVEPAEEGVIDGEKLKLVVPSALCGGLIGKSGATIQSYVEDSGANIKLSSQDQMMPGVNERIITITGSLEQQLRAVALIINKMSDDPNFPMHSSVLLSYPGSSGSPMNQGPSSHGNFTGMSPMGPMPTPPFPTGGSSAAETQVTVAVPDEHIGAIVGRAGKNISEMQQVSGVRIKISDREDYIPGTRNRKIILTGTLEAVQIAQFLISQKVQQSATEIQART